MATSNRTIPIIAVGVAVLAAVVYFGGGFPPGDELSGTVAPAERYRAKQITSDDVQLGDDSLQQFIQTDTYDRMIKDEALMAALNSAEFQAVLNNDELRSVLASEQFRATLASEQFRSSSPACSSEQAFDDVTGLVGTISQPAPAGSRNNTIKLTSNEIAGTVSVRNDNSLKVIDFNLTAGGPVEIVARYANQRVSFRGFAQLEDDNASVSISDGLVRMNMQGTNRYAMYLQHAGNVDSRVSFQFYASGLLIHEADLVLRAGE